MYTVECGALTGPLPLWEAGLLSEAAAEKPPSSCRPPPPRSPCPWSPRRPSASGLTQLMLKVSQA